MGDPLSTVQGWPAAQGGRTVVEAVNDSLAKGAIWAFEIAAWMQAAAGPLARTLRTWPSEANVTLALTLSV